MVGPISRIIDRWLGDAPSADAEHIANALRHQAGMRYEVHDEFGQLIAMTATRWAAERLIEGIKADDSPTGKLGSWYISAVR